MASRIPLTSIILGGKSKRSKKDLQAREDKEIKLGNPKLVLSPNVKKDKVAYAMWKTLVPLYDGIEYVTSADSEIIAQYCICHSELTFLIAQKNQMLKDLEADEESTALKTVVTINKSGIDNMINKKRKAKGEIGTKILLEPTARIKAIPLEEPKNKKKPDDPLDEFGLTG